MKQLVLALAAYILPAMLQAQTPAAEANVTTFFKSDFGNKDGLMDEALINGPDVIITDSTGVVYINDYRNYKVKKIVSGNVSTLMFYEYKKKRSLMASSIAFDPSHRLYIGAHGHIYKIDEDNNLFTVIETNLNGSATTTVRPIGSLDVPQKYISSGDVSSMQFDPQGNLFFICDMQIMKLSTDHKLTNIAGQGYYYKGLLDGPAATAKFNEPIALVLDSKGNIFLTDKVNNCIRKISTDNTVTTFAGALNAGFKDGKGIDARFKNPTGLTIDEQDNLYVCDMYNHAIRKISPDGEVNTIAGSVFGYSDGKGKYAQFQGPQSIYYNQIDKKLYVCDMGNNAIRVLSFE